MPGLPLIHRECGARVLSLPEVQRRKERLHSLLYEVMTPEKHHQAHARECSKLCIDAVLALRCISREMFFPHALDTLSIISIFVTVIIVYTRSSARQPPTPARRPRPSDRQHSSSISMTSSSAAAAQQHQHRSSSAASAQQQPSNNSPATRQHRNIISRNSATRAVPSRKDYACDKCEKKFGQKSKLFRHQKTVHEGRKDFACDKCEKKFGLKSQLFSHQKTVHEEREFPCNRSTDDSQCLDERCRRWLCCGRSMHWCSLMTLEGVGAGSAYCSMPSDPVGRSWRVRLQMIIHHAYGKKFFRWRLVAKIMQRLKSTKITEWIYACVLLMAQMWNFNSQDAQAILFKMMKKGYYISNFLTVIPPLTLPTFKVANIGYCLHSRHHDDSQRSSTSKRYGYCTEFMKIHHSISFQPTSEEQDGSNSLQRKSLDKHPYLKNHTISMPTNLDILVDNSYCKVHHELLQDLKKYT
ncbi:unnamed protein product, partial [Trichogramma brassicae]